MSANETRSPIKGKPLRQAGQSLTEQLDQLWDDKVVPWLLVSIFFTLWCAWEWLRYFKPVPPQPWIVTTFAAGAIAVSAWRVRSLLPRFRALRQGREGERVVGEFLERMREQGYRVFHDVPGDGFNLDHVLIGPGGVFTVETKTWSKPVRGTPSIAYDGEKILVNGQEPERDVTVQARSQSKWLKRLLQESAGRDVFVQPVVVFPGWFVEAPPGTQREVWVMEPKGLPAFLDRQSQQVSDEDVALYAFHLSRYVRTSQK